MYSEIGSGIVTAARQWQQMASASGEKHHQYHRASNIKRHQRSAASGISA